MRQGRAAAAWIKLEGDVEELRAAAGGTENRTEGQETQRDGLSRLQGEVGRGAASSRSHIHVPGTWRRGQSSGRGTPTCQEDSWLLPSSISPLVQLVEGGSSLPGWFMNFLSNCPHCLVAAGNPYRSIGHDHRKTTGPEDSGAHSFCCLSQSHCVLQTYAQRCRRCTEACALPGSQSS